MYTRQYKTKKTSTNSAETSTTNQFAPRRFVVQPDEEITKNQTSDLPAKSEKKRNLPNISVFPSNVTPQPSPIQMKLTIGQPGDKYEQEADRLAADVVQQINTPETQQVQREAAPEEEEVRMKPMVQRLSGAGGTTATPDLEESIQKARSSGQPLTESIREPMEQAFGADFSGVKVHTDAQSDELNQSIQAKAFTTGKDIFFRQGEYQPGNRGGQELIAHELTHVLQQARGEVGTNAAEQVVRRELDENDLAYYSSEEGAKTDMSWMKPEEIEQLAVYKANKARTAKWQEVLKTRVKATKCVSWDYGDDRYHINLTTDTYHVTKETSPKIHYFFQGTGMGIKDKQPTKEERGGGHGTKTVFSALPDDIQQFIMANFTALLI